MSTFRFSIASHAHWPVGGRYTPTRPERTTAYRTAIAREPQEINTNARSTIARDPTQDRQTALLQAAFRDLHGQRLHGFALLLTLGNRPVAAGVAASALNDGALRATELRHPERAAAWLRSRVLRLLPREPGRLSRENEGDRRAALRALGGSDDLFSALASLPTLERAALVLSTVERFDERDIETIVGRRGPELRRLLARARTSYLQAAAGTHAPPAIGADVGAPPGSLAARVRAEAARTLGGGLGPR